MLDSRKKLVILVSLFIAGAVFLLSWGMAYTSKGAFCARCHEIAPYAATWERFPHRKVTCLDCHADPGKVGYVLRKIKSAKEVINHLTGNYDPENLGGKFNQANCINCHNGSKNFPKAKNVLAMETTTKLNMSHKTHLDQKLKCLACHKTVVHGNRPANPRVSSINLDHRNTNCGECHDDFEVEGDPFKWEFEEECRYCHKFAPRKTRS